MQGLDFQRIKQKQSINSKNKFHFKKKSNIFAISGTKKNVLRSKWFSFFSKAMSSNNIVSIILSLGLFFFFVGMIIGSLYERSYLQEISWKPKEFLTIKNKELNTEIKDTPNKKKEYEYSNISKKDISFTKKKNNTIKDFVNSQSKKIDAVFFHLYIKKYSSEKEAVYYGSQLKKLKLAYKIFVTKNKGIYKLYIGPIEGKQEAYTLMQKIKSISEFQGAILYKNS